MSLDDLFHQAGAADVCRGCGRVREGTITFALDHQCRHVQLYNVFVQLFELEDAGNDKEKHAIAEIVLLTLGDNSTAQRAFHVMSSVVVPLPRRSDDQGRVRIQAAAASAIVEAIYQDHAALIAEFGDHASLAVEDRLPHWRELVMGALAKVLPIGCCLMSDPCASVPAPQAGASQP